MTPVSKRNGTAQMPQPSLSLYQPDPYVSNTFFFKPAHIFMKTYDPYKLCDKCIGWVVRPGNDFFRDLDDAQIGDNKHAIILSNVLWLSIPSARERPYVLMADTCKQQRHIDISGCFLIASRENK